MNILGGGELNQTHSGRYIGGQSLRASTKTGFVVSGGVTEKGQGRVAGICREGDRLIDGMSETPSSRDRCSSGSAFNTDSPKWVVIRSA